MSDSAVTRSNNVAHTQGTADAGVSRTALDQMRGSEVSPADQQAARQMDFSKIKESMLQMQMQMQQHQQQQGIFDALKASPLRHIKG